MRFTIAFIFGLLVLTQATELSLPFQNALAQIKEKAQGSDWGKTFHALLELTVNQEQTKTEEVIQKIRELKDKLTAELQQDAIEFSTKSAGYEADIESLQVQLERQQNELRLSNLNKADLQQELASLVGTRRSLQRQVQLGNGREEQVRNSRAADIENFNTRQRSNTRVIDALNQIIQMLTQAVFSENGRQNVLTEMQKKDVVQKLKNELGNDNPLTMLVQMTSKFDVPTVTKVIQRLENLRNSIQNTQISDAQKNDQAEVSFITILQQLADVRQKLEQDLQALNSLIARKTNDKNLFDRTIEQLQSSIPLIEQALTNTQTQYDLYRTQYQARRFTGNQQLEIITTAYQLITSAQDKLTHGEQETQA